MNRLMLVIALTVLAPAAAWADSWSGGPPGSAFQPWVPVSALARPAAWLDPSRLHLTTSLSVGSGFAGTQALQVTTLGYQFRAPVWFNVSVGNAWGLASSSSRAGSPFLEGLDLGFRPTPSMLVRLQYHDFRSPLQYNAFDNPYGLWGR
ncbi:MAG: hypothetical protein HYR73_08825 [Candidatus Eisenbacteria bacterium]|nr:hypothetical protein [Candidatus Eisenbacteria bacterium]